MYWKNVCVFTKQAEFLKTMRSGVIYAIHENGLIVITYSTIVLNTATSAIGSASSRTALLVTLLCTKSTIVFSGSRPWVLGLE